MHACNLCMHAYAHIYIYNNIYRYCLHLYMPAFILHRPKSHTYIKGKYDHRHKQAIKHVNICTHIKKKNEIVKPVRTLSQVKSANTYVHICTYTMYIHICIYQCIYTYQYTFLNAERYNFTITSAHHSSEWTFPRNYQYEINCQTHRLISFNKIDT